MEVGRSSTAIEELESFLNPPFWAPRTDLVLLLCFFTVRRWCCLHYKCPTWSRCPP